MHTGQDQNFAGSHELTTVVCQTLLGMLELQFCCSSSKMPHGKQTSLSGKHQCLHSIISALHLPYYNLLISSVVKRETGEVLVLRFTPFGIDGRNHVGSEIRDDLSLLKKAHFSSVIICLVGLPAFFANHIRSYCNQSMGYLFSANPAFNLPCSRCSFALS